MALRSTRQSPVQSVSGRATVTQLGRSQQPQSSLLSGRAAVGHLGVGRRYTGHTDLFVPRQLHLPTPPEPNFYRLRADAEILKRRLAVRDTVVARPPAPARAQTPRAAGYPVPFLSPAEQTRRAREMARIRQQVLADYNKSAKALYMPLVLRKSYVSLLAKVERERESASAASDLFMPISFWHTQYQETPKGWKSTFIKGKHGKPGYWTKFDHWRDCCNTCKRLIKKELGAMPQRQVQIVLERGGGLVSQPTATAGFAELDNYMALHKPVMVGVDFALGKTYNRDKTTEHFVVLVGTGVEKGRKYYRFFDVGTSSKEKGTNPKFKLYYNAALNSYTGKGLLGTYTITQLRF